MAVLFLLAFRFVRLLLSGHQGVALENAALRMQIAAFQRKRKRPLLTTVDRVFWITLRSLWDNWRKPLLYVQPDTVVRWQRERFRKFWARLSKPQHRGRGRPGTSAELRRLIAQMVAANPLWRAPRIPWRTQDARYRHLRTHCLTPPAQTPPPAEPDLEDIPAQPYRSHGVDRFLYRADHHDEGAVRIHCPGT